MVGVPQSVRLAYQSLQPGQYSVGTPAYNALAGTFAPYSNTTRKDFYDWLYAKRAGQQTYVVAAALRVHEFCKSDQAYA